MPLVCAILPLALISQHLCVLNPLYARQTVGFPTNILFLEHIVFCCLMSWRIWCLHSQVWFNFWCMHSTPWFLEIFFFTCLFLYCLWKSQYLTLSSNFCVKYKYLTLSSLSSWTSLTQHYNLLFQGKPTCGNVGNARILDVPTTAERFPPPPSQFGRKSIPSFAWCDESCLISSPAFWNQCL